MIGVRDERPDPEPPPDREPDFPDDRPLGGLYARHAVHGRLVHRPRATRRASIGSSSRRGPTSSKGALADLRPLHTLVIVPKDDIRAIAARHCGRAAARRTVAAPRNRCRCNRSGMQLVSYLLFESGFTRELIDMGFPRRARDGGRAARVPLRPADGHPLRPAAPQIRHRPLTPIARWRGASPRRDSRFAADGCREADEAVSPA